MVLIRLNLSKYAKTTNGGVNFPPPIRNCTSPFEEMCNILGFGSV
jgi:hypothetical protein